MASLVDYRGLQVVSPNPSGDGGMAIQNNLKNLVDWSPKGVWGQTTSPTANDDDTEEYYPGSFWLRTNTTPSQLFVCKSSAATAAEWLPILLTLSQDSTPKLGGDLDVANHKITDTTAVAIAIGGTSVATVTSNSLQTQGSFLLGTTTVPTGATFNSVLGGGSTSPVIGPPTADVVSLAAVDRTAGDRRLYIQSEAGSAISVGNDRLNFAGLNGYLSQGNSDVIAFAAGATSIFTPLAFSKSFVDGGNGVSILSPSSLSNSITTNSSNILYGINNDIRLNQNGFNATHVGAVIANYSSATAMGTSGTVTGVQAFSGRAGNSSTGVVTTATCFYAQQAQNFAGGALTNWQGVFVEASTVATNIYGIRSQIASSSNRWNLYLDGTADNYVAGKIGLAAQTVPLYPLHVKGNGRGAAIMVDRVGNGAGNGEYWGYAVLNSTAGNNMVFGTTSSTFTSGSPPFGWAGNSEDFISMGNPVLRIGYDTGGTPLVSVASTSGMAIGSKTYGTGASYNIALGGGSTSPTLGAAATDLISLAAVDEAAGDRRLYLQSELGLPISLGNDRLNFVASAGTISIGGSDILSVSASTLTLTDAINVVVGATTGSKIGTSANQKIGLWNATPVSQYNTTGTTTGFTAATGTAVLSGSSFTGNTGSTAYTIGDLVAALKRCGIIAS